jgi:hypothetical protein
MRKYRNTQFILLVLVVTCLTGFGVLGLATPETTTLAETGNHQFMEEGDFFSTSGVCVECHTGIMAESGSEISFDIEWRSSTMAQAATDPYWLASVRKESIANPEALTAVIQDVCATCHMPMARVTAAANEQPTMVLGDGFANTDHALYPLAIEGVSCTLCHQIQPAENLGEHESFDGGYTIDLESAPGDRTIYGTVNVSGPWASTMARYSGYRPRQSEHVGESELCATCHNLTTPFLDENDEIAGTFPEQMPYTEWQNSVFNGEKSCQDCHMPAVEGRIPVSANDTRERSGVGRHTFIGGNTYLLALLRGYGVDPALMVSAEEFEANQQLTADFLATQTAALALENATVSGSVLTADVVIQSLSGHKLPTSFPSRRMWLHFSVTDASGSVVFESGDYEENGLILGNDNDADPVAYEPHYTEITSSDQVQIYETIMANTEDMVTTTLLRAARYLKDNRIPPEGYDKDNVPEEIAAHGLATEDENFVGGSDTVTYRVELGDAQGPFNVSVELLYQSIGYRWAMNLQPYADASGVYDQTPNLPALIAFAEVPVE